MLPVSHVDFRNFLKLVIPGNILPSYDLGLAAKFYLVTIVSQVSLSKKEWLSDLKTIQSVELLGSTSDGVITTRRKRFWTSERVGREFFIPDCLLSGYLELVTRNEPITDEEATAIGLLAAVRLYRVRENYNVNFSMTGGSYEIEYTRSTISRRVC